MRIAVTGSIATDHLMAYRGRFTEQFLGDRLDRVSLSFLADSLEVRHGGVAANISLGLARLGVAPVLVGAAGKDFAEYGSWLRDNGVDTAHVHLSETLHTARFVCTTDLDHNQIATFYAGAMTEAVHATLTSVQERTGRLDLALVGPNDPRAMLLLTRECRRLGIPFAADPSQQLARLSGPEARRLVRGARFLFTNEYEAALLQERTGWTEEEVLRQAGVWLLTRGAAGVDIGRSGQPWLHVDAVPTTAVGEPTGVGDAFRAGFLAGVAGGLSYEPAARLGCALATVVLQVVGTQEYKLSATEMLASIEASYGSDAVRELEPHLPSL
ncbi:MULTISPECIES: carbohydrate kinase family protein [unclassified Streptomyces]|uniref:carbohydrate kinase family protein n=1 Tax=unclassified Streptomyces TaxID=2593676 RepID=UPI00093E2352|nr:carbohydrate kinase family protein [Streptomyces sp. CB02414]OKI81370.1 ribokinase [Streptomyces sp. CB02414]